jgi:hypothetical protein
MRFLVKVVMDVEAGNRLAKAGKLGPTIQSILEELKPEAAYFLDTDGQRCGLLFLVMVPEDLAKAGGSIEAAAKKYG